MIGVVAVAIIAGQMMTANENPGLTIDLTHDFAHDLAHPTGSKRCPNPSPKSCHYQHLLESPLHRAYQ